jgi:hypothetical protein
MFLNSLSSLSYTSVAPVEKCPKQMEFGNWKLDISFYSLGLYTLMWEYDNIDGNVQIQHENLLIISLWTEDFLRKIQKMHFSKMVESKN